MLKSDDFEQIKYACDTLLRINRRNPANQVNLNVTQQSMPKGVALDPEQNRKIEELLEATRTFTAMN